MKTPPKKGKSGNGRSISALLEATRFRPGSLEAELAAIAAKIPKRELARLPRDLASNVDHYVYGAPKKR